MSKATEKPEYQNITAKCIDRDNPADEVMHEVSYDCKDPDGNWIGRVVTKIMATDPMDAIKRVRTT